jgi:hypothetical protein
VFQTTPDSVVEHVYTRVVTTSYTTLLDSTPSHEVHATTINNTNVSGGI